MLAPARLLAPFTALFVLTSFVAGCLNTDITGTELDLDEGTVSFDYVGDDLDGRFNASGAFYRDDRGIVKRSSFAAGIDVYTTLYMYFGIIAAEFDSNDTMHDLNITISRQARGNYEVMSFERCAAEMEIDVINCAAISYTLGLDHDGGYKSGTRAFELVEGTLNVSSFSDGRLRGTFSGKAREIGSSGSKQYLDGVEIEIDNGDFDVPLVSLEKWNGMARTHPFAGELQLPAAND